MIINGRRVSRDALTGDPGFFGSTGLATFRQANRPVALSRNSITASAMLMAPKGGGFFGGLKKVFGAIGGALAPGLFGGPAGLLLGPATGAARGLFGAARGGLRAGRSLAAFGGFGPGRGMGGERIGRRRRRMRVTNVKALRRALRRVEGFGRIAHRFVRVRRTFRTHPLRRRAHGRRAA